MPPDAQTSLLTYILGTVQQMDRNHSTQDAAIQHVARLLKQTKTVASMMTEKNDRDLVEKAGVALTQLLISRGCRIDDTLLRTGRATAMHHNREPEAQSWAEWFVFPIG